MDEGAADGEPAGEAQALKAAASSLHSNVEPASDDENVNVAEVLPTVP